MSGAPVTLDEPPGPSHVDRVPGVSEPVVLKLDPGLVAGRLAVTLDHDAVETSVTKEKTYILFVCCKDITVDNKCHKSASENQSLDIFMIYCLYCPPSGGSIKRMMMKTFDFSELMVFVDVMC